MGARVHQHGLCEHRHSPDDAHRARTQCQCNEGRNGNSTTYLRRSPSPSTRFADNFSSGKDGQESIGVGAVVWVTHDDAAEDGGGYPLKAPEASRTQVAYGGIEHTD